MNSWDRDKGIVYLVGAGPGDEGLITLKSLNCIRRSQVIVYDYLVNEKLLGYCPEECERIYAGKRAGEHTLSQEEINILLIKKAKEGKIVTRLKGGDPFVFGRGGEEALALVDAGVPFEIVPGVTAAVAASAYAGIPVTHRGLSSSLTLLTGHEDQSKKESTINWDKLATGTDTIVIYMGIKNLSEIVNRLKESGKPGNTPAALIRWGTLNRQQTLTSTLDTITEQAEKARLKPPAILIVGKVVELRKKLKWFDNRPLFGKKIVVTRTRSQASVLSAMLGELGAEVVEFPTIDILPLTDLTPLDEAIRHIEEFSWIVFTSVNGVDIFFKCLFDLGYDSRALHKVKIAVIGKATGKQLTEYGIKPDLIPEVFTSEGTVKAFRSISDNYTGKRILLPGSAISGDLLPEELTKMGAEVLRIPIYHNVIPEYSRERVASLLGVDSENGSPDLVTFTSSSTVRNFVEILEKTGFRRYVNSIRGASIGPVTSGAAEELGVRIAVEAAEQSIQGLVDSILSLFTNTTTYERKL